MELQKGKIHKRDVFRADNLSRNFSLFLRLSFKALFSWARGTGTLFRDKIAQFNMNIHFPQLLFNF